MSEMNIVRLIDNRLKQDLSELETQKANEIKLLHEDMSRKGQLNGTPSVMRVQNFCSQEIQDATAVTIKIINDFLATSDLNYSPELSSELQKIVKENFIKTGNYLKRFPQINNDPSPTLKIQMKSADNEIENQRKKCIDKIITEIELLMLSLANKAKAEKDLIKKKDLSNTKEPAHEDIIDIEPNFYGIGLNLNALSRKIKSIFSKKENA